LTVYMSVVDGLCVSFLIDDWWFEYTS